jgi:hypothetical protein
LRRKKTSAPVEVPRLPFHVSYAQKI